MKKDERDSYLRLLHFSCHYIFVFKVIFKLFVLDQDLIMINKLTLNSNLIKMYSKNAIIITDTKTNLTLNNMLFFLILIIGIGT